MPYLPICGRLDFGFDFSGALVILFSLGAAAFEVAALASGVLEKHSKWCFPTEGHIILAS